MTVKAKIKANLNKQTVLPFFDHEAIMYTETVPMGQKLLPALL